jgi:hypothetical protein
VADFQPQNLDPADLLHGAIGTLPILQPEVVNLTFFEGLSQREIAVHRSIALGHSEDAPPDCSEETLQPVSPTPGADLISFPDDSAGETRACGLKR